MECDLRGRFLYRRVGGRQGQVRARQHRRRIVSLLSRGPSGAFPLVFQVPVLNLTSHRKIQATSARHFLTTTNCRMSFNVRLVLVVLTSFRRPNTTTTGSSAIKGALGSGAIYAHPSRSLFIAGCLVLFSGFMLL